MTRRPLSFLTFILFLASCYQADKNNKDENKYTCEWGTNEANKDISNDSLFLIDCGLPEPSRQTYFKLLNRHQIYIKFSVGCSMDDGVKCYNDLMTEIIQKRNGLDFFTKLRQQADSIYKLTNNQTE